MLKQDISNWFAMIILAVFLFSLVGSPNEARAQWHPSNDTKKGTISTTTLVLIAAGAAAVFLIYKISKTKKMEDEEKDERQALIPGSSRFSHSNHLILPYTQFEKFQESIFRAQNEMPFSVYIGVSDNSPGDVGMTGISSKLSNNAIVLGMSLSF